MLEFSMACLPDSMVDFRKKNFFSIFFFRFGIVWNAFWQRFAGQKIAKNVEKLRKNREKFAKIRENAENANLLR